MADAANGWAQPGVEVVTVIHGFASHRYGVRNRIAKVHKNGNFVLEGSPQQYRPQRDGYASATGDAWRMNDVRMVTPEVLEAIKAERRVNAARRVIRAWADRLSAVERSNDAEAIIAEAERLGHLQDRDGEVNRGE